jgi:hypothetical protein
MKFTYPLIFGRKHLRTLVRVKKAGMRAILPLEF